MGKRGPKRFICDGEFDPKKCLECEYPKCILPGHRAVNGGIGDIIQEALGDEKPQTQAKEEHDEEYYKQMLKRQLERQNKRRKLNQEKYAKEQSLIRQCRKARGWKQHELAVRCGVAEHTISCWECGTVPAKWDLVEKAMPELKQKREELSKSAQETKSTV